MISLSFVMWMQVNPQSRWLQTVRGIELLLTLKLSIRRCAIVAIDGALMTLRSFSSRWNRVLCDAEVELIKLDFIPYEKHQDNCCG